MSIVSNLFLFENTDYCCLEKKYNISDNTVVQNHEKGEIILSFESENKGIFVLLSGTARILSGGAGRKAVLRDLKAGDVFGAASLFDGGDIYKTAVVSGGCETALLPKSLVLKIVTEESAVALNYLRFLSGRVSFLNKKISAFTAGSAEQKLAVYLSGAEFTDGVHSLDVSYTSLAAMLGIGRASLYRALDLFEDEGIIRRDGKNIYLTDDNALAEYI